MADFSSKQIQEMNEIIEAINKVLKPTHEIGTRDRKILVGLLHANKIEATPKFFACRREYSGPILTHFTKEKNVPRNKFSTNAQPFIYLI
jgi:hypothetical protein